MDIYDDLSGNDSKTVALVADEYTHKYTNSNRKDEAIEVEVIQRIGHRNWKVQNASSDYTKVDASRVKFSIPVPANKEVVLTYTSRVNLK